MLLFLVRFPFLLSGFLFASVLLADGAMAQAFYPDVPRDVWYAGAVNTFLAEQILDAREASFRPGDDATRAELIELLVKLRGDAEALVEPEPFFSDVSAESPLFDVFQSAAATKLVRGAGDCIGMDSCFAYPFALLNRAEAAALMNRAFALSLTYEAPLFDDATGGAWYSIPVQAAADHCILQGDERSDNLHMVRPEAHMNRAEMIVMVDRARKNLRYGIDCEREERSEVQEESADRLRPPRNDGPDEITKFSGEQSVPPPQAPYGVALMRFDMSAHPVQDIIIRRLTFEAAQGSLLNAEDYALWVDHDRDGTVETLLEGGQAADAGFVSFDSLYGGGYIVTQETVSFEVRASISGSPVSSILQIQFATDGILAEELDGETLDGGFQIVQQKTPAKIFTILSHGNLFVTQSSIPIPSHQLLGGTVSDPILRLTFRADGEDIDVTELRLTSSGSTLLSVDRLELFREGESTSFADATVGGCGTDDVLTANPIDGSAVQNFCVQLASGKFVIPEDERRDLFVHARMKTDQDGGISGETVQLWLTGQAIPATISGSGSVRARGLSSSEILSANDGDPNREGELFIGTETGANQNIIGPSHTSALSRLASITNAHTDSDGTPVPSGTHSLGSFHFAASSNENIANGRNDVTLDGIIFTVSATNTELAASSFVLFNTADASTEHVCAALDTSGASLFGEITGAFLVSCENLDVANIATMIGSSESITLTLKGEVTDSQVDSGGRSALQISLQNFSSPAESFGATTSHMHWIDEDPAGSMDFYWTDMSETEVSSTLYQL